MNDGQPPLNANVAQARDSVDHDEGSSELLEDNEVYLEELPPEFTLIGAMGTKPRSF